MLKAYFLIAIILISSFSFADTFPRYKVSSFGYEARLTSLFSASPVTLQDFEPTVDGNILIRATEKVRVHTPTEEIVKRSFLFSRDGQILDTDFEPYNFNLEALLENKNKWNYTFTKNNLVIFGSQFFQIYSKNALYQKTIDYPENFFYTNYYLASDESFVLQGCDENYQKTLYYYVNIKNGEFKSFSPKFDTEKFCSAHKEDFIFNDLKGNKLLVDLKSMVYVINLNNGKRKIIPEEKWFKKGIRVESVAQEYNGKILLYNYNYGDGELLSVDKDANVKKYFLPLSSEDYIYNLIVISKNIAFISFGSGINKINSYFLNLRDSSLEKINGIDNCLYPKQSKFDTGISCLNIFDKIIYSFSLY